MDRTISFPGESQFDAIMSRAHRCLEGAQELRSSGKPRAAQGALNEALSCVEQASLVNGGSHAEATCSGPDH